MKNKNAILIGLLFGAIALIGCVQVPKTKISGKIGGQPFNLQTPKDTDLSGLDITAKTNGETKIHIDLLKTRMNPDVVNQTAEGQAKIVQATLAGTGGIVGDAVKAALEAYLKSLGVPAPGSASTSGSGVTIIPVSAAPSTPSTTSTNTPAEAPH